jgi:hypothetical protein
MKVDLNKIAHDLRGLRCRTHHKGVTITAERDSILMENACCDQFANEVMQQYARSLDKPFLKSDENETI